MNILFICRGNVGRSQMAAALLSKLHPEYQIKSAGTKVVGKDGTSRNGQLLKNCKGAENVIDVVKEIGIDISEHSRTQLEQDMLNNVDRVIVMSEPEFIPDYLRNYPGMVYWDVEDPRGTDLDGHRSVLNKIDSLIKQNINLFS